MAAGSVNIKFGTDGWRGVMAREFTFDNVRRVAQAISDYLKNRPGKPKRKPLVVIAYDQRFQSDAFAAEVARVVDANGIRAILASETLPTPALSLLTQKLKAVGVMVTASHNPPSYNGIKIKLEGRAATEDVTAAVESCLDRSNPMRNGGELERKSFRKDYLQFLRSRINPGSFMAKLKRPIVIDYLHGSSAGCLGELMRGKKVIEIRGERDPMFGGVHPEPIDQYLGELKDQVVKEKALMGLALDGDGDRFALVDDKGRYMTPCQVFPMLAEYLITHKKVKGKIVQAVSLGYLAGRIAEAHGLEFEELPVGFKHVGEQIATGQAAIGGEESGGYAWKGGQPERDGMLTGLLFMEMCAKTKKTPSQLWEGIEKKYGKSYFRRVDFRLHRAAVDKAAFTAKITKRLPKKIAGVPIKSVLNFDGVKIYCEDKSWVLLRPSGTEPLIRTYAESDSQKRTKALLEAAAKWSHSHL